MSSTGTHLDPLFSSPTGCRGSATAHARARSGALRSSARLRCFTRRTLPCGGALHDPLPLSRCSSTSVLLDSRTHSTTRSERLPPPLATGWHSGDAPPSARGQRHVRSCQFAPLELSRLQRPAPGRVLGGWWTRAATCRRRRWRDAVSAPTLPPSGARHPGYLDPIYSYIHWLPPLSSNTRRAGRRFN